MSFCSWNNDSCYFTIYASNIIPHTLPIQTSFSFTSNAKDLYSVVAQKLTCLAQQYYSHLILYQLRSNVMISTISQLGEQMENDVKTDNYSHFFIIITSQNKSVGILPFHEPFNSIFTKTNHIKLQLVHKTDVDSWIPEIELKYRKYPHKFSIDCKDSSHANSLSMSIEYKSISLTIDEEIKNTKPYDQTIKNHELETKNIVPVYCIDSILMENKKEVSECETRMISRMNNVTHDYKNTFKQVTNDKISQFIDACCRNIPRNELESEYLGNHNDANSRIKSRIMNTKSMITSLKYLWKKLSTSNCDLHNKI